MNKLIGFGMSLFKKTQNKDQEEESGGSGFLGNPLDMFKQLDKNGDGTITEEG